MNDKTKKQGNNVSLWQLIIVCLVIIALVGFLIIFLFGDKPWISTLGYLVAASSIAVAGCVAYHHLRIIQLTERAAVLTNLDCTFMSSELEKCRISYLELRNEFKLIDDPEKKKKYFKDKLREIMNTKPEKYRELMRMINFFETLGYFSKVGYVSSSDAIELYGPAIREMYENFKDHVVELQEESNDKEIYNYFLWIAEKAIAE